MAKLGAATPPASTASNRSDDAIMFDEQVKRQLLNDLSGIFDGPTSATSQKRARDANEKSEAVDKKQKKAKRSTRKEVTKEDLSTDDKHTDSGADENVVVSDEAAYHETEEDEDKEDHMAQLPVSAIRRDALIATITKSRSPEKSQISQSSPNSKQEPRSRKRSKVSYAFVLPHNYKTTLVDGATRYACPVITCDRDFSRADTLKGHLNKDHLDKGEILANNIDETTMCIVGHRGADEPATGDVPTPLFAGESSVSVSAMPIRAPAARSSILHSKVARETPATPTPAGPSARVVKSKKSTATKNAKTVPTPDADEVEDEEDAEEQQGDREKTTAGHQKPTSKVEPPPKSHKEKSTLGNSKSAGATGSLEDWEVKPGRLMRPGELHSESDGVACALAFSANITTAPNFIQLPGITFQVLRIPCGPLSAAQVFQSVPAGFVQLCSVAAGKVLVAVTPPPPEDTHKHKNTSATTEFAVGPHGAWHLRQGERCTVSNLRYEDAVLHVSVAMDEVR